VLKIQIEKLNKKWFKIDFNKLEEFVKDNWYWEYWINKWLMSYILFNWLYREYNIGKFRQLFWNVDLENDKIYSFFYYECFKSDWKFYDEYKVENIKYEADINDLWTLSQADNAILSIAHPNFSFRQWIEEFKNELPYYLDAWINAIELNVKANKKWVETILDLKNKYNLILTFGSDCHQIWWDDDKHADFWTTNPYISQEILRENMEKFRKKIEI
jgi:hypothetical protein